MKKVILLDGSGFLYRSYHALPPLNDADGHNVNTIYGFFRMLLRLFHEKPDYFAIVWDSPGKTIRHEQFQDYKANRPKMPDEFKWQINMVSQLVDEIGIVNFRVPTYEADDIIYSLVNNFNDGETMILIESLDKDLKQLLDKNIYLSNNSKSEIVSKDLFVTEFGFEPVYMLDYLSLIGDASDNIPGVKGIGKVTALDLIKKYSTIENIYNNIDEINGKVKENLMISKDIAFKSKELVLLHTVPGIGDVKISDLKFDFDFNKFEEILVEKYSFKSIGKSLIEVKKKYQCGDQLCLF
ncbi:MAG: 5'-3' exonuclease H3TH domain-containing protein [Candidatus Absconditabacteria bacterium]